MHKKQKSNVVFGLLGTTVDVSKTSDRFATWRPSVAICQHPDLPISRFELLYQKRYLPRAKKIQDDISIISQNTIVRLNEIQFHDPWDFESVYSALYDFAQSYNFTIDEEDYFIHLTTGTNTAQVCLFLLAESRHLPGKLIQTRPPNEGKQGPGEYRVTDLDLSKYDQIALRLRKEKKHASSYLKSGIKTLNLKYNDLIDRIEHVAVNTRHPILLIGPTGAGKSLLAKRIYELKLEKHIITGEFAEVNCATIRGEVAMSTLFGHEKGAFTSAISKREGHLRKANKGILFLDEIGELGLDEQAMLLHALEEKEFYPLGGDKKIKSDFQLIAGTNQDLLRLVREGRFREDLFARIKLWTFHLPALRDRLEDIFPNIKHEIEKYGQSNGTQAYFTKEALDKFLEFSTSLEAKWLGNFRDLNCAITRMATLALSGRITVDIVEEEVGRLRSEWESLQATQSQALSERLLGKDHVEQLDLFVRIQLEGVLNICHKARSLSEAGRILYSSSRGKKKMTNDADRLRKYLSRFGLTWNQVYENLKHLH